MCNFSIPSFGVSLPSFQFPSIPGLPGFSVEVPGLRLSLILPTILPFVPVFSFSLPSIPSIALFAIPALGLALKLSIPALKAFVPSLFAIPSIPSIPGFDVPCPLE